MLSRGDFVRICAAYDFEEGRDFELFVGSAGRILYLFEPHCNVPKIILLEEKLRGFTPVTFVVRTQLRPRHITREEVDTVYRLGDVLALEAYLESAR